MKITDVKLRFAKHYLFVQVYTDAGIVGLGEAGNWGYLQATAAAIEKFATYLIGKDPFRIEDYNQNFLRSVYFRRFGHHECHLCHRYRSVGYQGQGPGCARV